MARVDGLCPEGGCYDIRRKLLADGGLLIKNGVLGIFARGARIFGALHLTWIMTLLADAVVLLRAQALLSQPRPTAPLGELTPKQLSFSWN